MKKLLAKASTTLLLAGFALQAHAYDGTINFTGSVSNVTCTITAAGGTNTGTVNMPTVTAGAFKAVGDSAGTTQFSIKLSGCTGTPAPTQAAAWFETGTNVNPAGRVIAKNAAAPLDTSLSIGLYNVGSATPIAIGQGNGSIGSSGSAFTITAGGATMNYQAKYYAEQATVTPGAITGNVNYTIQYQ